MMAQEILRDVHSRVCPGNSAKPLVAVGMSGGVDSSTVAALLAGEYRVVGLTMQLWDQRRLAAADPAAPRPDRARARLHVGPGRHGPLR